MHPAKGVFDYMTEMNKLFPRNELNDVFRTPNNASTSPFNHLTPAKSSSSAGSTPPDMFPDFSNVPQRDFETPYIIRRQRPIIGRRLMTDTPLDQKLERKTEEYFTNIWQTDEPPSHDRYNRQRNQKDFYELFPKENKGFDMTPIKNKDWTVSPTYLSSQLNVSPTWPSIGTNSPNVGQSHPTSPRSVTGSVYGAGTSKYLDRPKVCTFCRKNGETPLVYTTHTVKQLIGGKHIVTCPILRSHVCSTCGSSGDDAHTITYCPVLRSTNNGLPLQSTTITLKNTRVKSNGKRRY